MSAFPPHARHSDAPPVNPYASPMSSGYVPSTDAEAIRRELLSHEASVCLIGTLYYLGAFLALPLALFPLGMMLRGEGDSFVFILLLIIVGFIMTNVMIGRGLRRFHPAARIVASLFALMGLMAFPIGTLISGYILYLLYSPKGNRIFSAEYQEIIRQTPDISYRFPLATTFVAVVLILAIAGGVAWLVVAG
jgi:hypothetical protein